ncbi:MAG: hypothetical protein Q9198_006808 [Flavoplaca austrocitrina]
MTMSSKAIYASLLRPPVLHILRAAGFHATKPAVLDTLVDLTARYLSLLASNAAAHAQGNHHDLILTVTDIRMALQDVGAIWPQKSAMEEDLMGEEDMRGFDNFLKWMMGDEHREIRRVAGWIGTEAPLPGIDESAGREDFLTALKRKHNKTGESSRFQGTVLGTNAEEKPILIEGGPVESLQDWGRILRKTSAEDNTPPSREPSSALTSCTGSPLTPI